MSQKKNTVSPSNHLVSELKIVAKNKESVRRKLAAKAKRLKNEAAQLALTVRKKEKARHKLVIIAKEKENARQKLALTAKKLSVLAKEKESARKKLATTVEQLKRKDEQLVVTLKELKAFSYSVAHDLRAPLRAVEGFTQILVQDYAEKLGDEGKRITAIIRASTIQMGKMIDDLLSFSRLGRQTVKKSTIAMRTLVDETYKQLTQSMHAGGEFSIREIPDAKADVEMIRQVWTNLLSNALKFTSKKEKAKIEVGSTSDSTSITYYVKDNGAGFDMKYIDKLFGVFQRLHAVDEFEGTGVGLANVKRIIERHGGMVWAEAKVGAGATFYFTLPKI